MRRQRTLSPFNLSFLDVMFCGFGAVVLLVMLLNGDMLGTRKELVADLKGEVNRLEHEVEAGEDYLVQLQNSLHQTDEEITEASGGAIIVRDRIKQTKKELADMRAISLADRKHINQLQADLKNIDTESRRLRALKQAEQQQGQQVRKFVGQGDRQYLTGLRLGGKRVLLLVDVSASMLDETIVNIILRRNLNEEVQRSSPKWQRVLKTVDWLLANLPPESSVQIYTFNTKASSVLDDLQGKWIKSTDSKNVNRMIAAMQQKIPKGGTSLYNGFAAVRSMVTKPDNILLLTDGLPTQGKKKSKKTTVSGEERIKHFNSAIAVLPKSIPVNTILFPMEGDPMAAALFWQLAIQSSGSFLTPARDWP